MNAALSSMTRGLHDPVHGAQQVFRVLLDAMARPGRVLALPAAATAGVEPPPGLSNRLSRGMAAALLTLLDAETTVRLHGGLASDAARSYLRFHTGVREPAAADQPEAFAAVDARHATAALLRKLHPGSDEAPQQGATLLVEVEALDAVRPLPGAALLQLRGPGIEAVHALAVAGVEPAFWRQRIALQPLCPRGIDLLLVCGERIAAVPRSTRMVFEG